ncbi:MAG TPA: zf-HC2 domain-containing protein [Actinomycetota bacterium]
MRCEQASAYLPGYAGGDLRQDTTRAVARHLAGCTVCRSEVEQLERVTTGLRSLTERPLEPPPMLLDTVLESVSEPRRRLIPPIVPPNVAPELMRLVQENREVIAQAGATALVAAGTAYALWRAIRGRRVAGQPVTS